MKSTEEEEATEKEAFLPGVCSSGLGQMSERKQADEVLEAVGAASAGFTHPLPINVQHISLQVKTKTKKLSIPLLLGPMLPGNMESLDPQATLMSSSNSVRRTAEPGRTRSKTLKELCWP